MKHSIYIAVAMACIFMSVQAAQAQVTDPSAFYERPDTMHGKTLLIPSGTTFEGRIDTTIGSHSHRGQRFAIVLASPLIANGVDVLVPSGAQVLGEVVEAIPSSALPHKRGQPKPLGKLRVQVTALRMPDGMIFPLVASIVGETFGTGPSAQRNPELGGGVAYMGSQANFALVNPGASHRFRGRNGGLATVTPKSELLRDPLYGRDQDNQSSFSAKKQNIRSLTKKGNDLYIFSGSPLTVHLDAPLKIGIAASPAGTTLLAPTFGQTELETGIRAGRRFARPTDGAGNGTTSAPKTNGAASPYMKPPNPLPGILPDPPSLSTQSSPNTASSGSSGSAPSSPPGTSPNLSPPFSGTLPGAPNLPQGQPAISGNAAPSQGTGAVLAPPTPSNSNITPEGGIMPGTGVPVKGSPTQSNVPALSPLPQHERSDGGF
jgi:hypothetical protein